MDLSTRLSYLFGTEEYVGMRRQLALLRENVLRYMFETPRLKVNFICSGSLGEGVAYPRSDDDVMISLMNSRIVMTYREATQAWDLLMVPSDSSPGYCRLLDMKGSYPGYVIHIIHDMPFVSSSLWKQQFVGGTLYIHGPCQSQTLGTEEYDYAVCIPCITWPDIANEWAVRNRPYGWPSCEMINNIIHNGCHVVPIGDPDTPYADLEWRISFSVAERTLMHSCNHAQFLVYNLLRLTLKRVIDKAFPEVICSYFMKTSLFYTVENTYPDFWLLGNLEACFRSCLSVLYDYVYHTYCPNYFLPEYNMIKRKINQTNRQQKLYIIRFVHAIGIVGILYLSRESSCLDTRLSSTIMEYKLDREFLFSDHIEKCIADIERVSLMIPHENTELCTINLYNFWGLLKCNPSVIQSDIIYIIWNAGINSFCLKIMDLFSSSSKMNKHNYRLNRSLEPLLRIGLRANVTTGKLTMATYMYMVGKTESALYFIRQLLSEYPPFALDISGDNLKKQAYKEVICGLGLTINYKVRHAYAPLYHLDQDCLNAYPSSLKIWITMMDDGLDIDPIVYAYLLESLCHVEHQNNLLLMISLKCLLNYMDDLKGSFFIIFTRMYVGIIKYVQGDNQSACRWLGSAYVMTFILPSLYKEMFSNSTLTYIACLLKKKFKSVTRISIDET